MYDMHGEFVTRQMLVNQHTPFITRHDTIGVDCEILVSGVLFYFYYLFVCLQVDEQTIRVHRCILAAHSEVFLSMFSNDMIEAECGRVTITDASYPVVCFVCLCFIVYLFIYHYPDRCPDRLLLHGLESGANERAST